ncbi:MAG: hypothetical protein COA73_14670 [Candidatus Hydrogenedentota bacterium]|nr:MAG: hypothetical protein COA73_14670 [Candidatus Hydrogenedentota bacterium]
MITNRKHDITNIRSTKRPAEFRKLLKRFPKRPVIISEGDSWFAYPTRFFGGIKRSNVIDHIERARRFNLLRLERNGDEAMSMITGSQQHTLSRFLKEFSDRLDILLFSGGGNDLVGPWDLELFLNQKLPGMSWHECIRHDRFDRKLAMIKLGYLE